MPVTDRIPRAGRALAAGLIAALALTGCVTRAAAAARIQVSTAYVAVPQAGTTVAYVVIRNNGAADRLQSAHTSAGGHVVFRAAAGVRQLRGGKVITLILDFAHAGPVQVVAQVTNPATGGSSYLLN
jgi:copper(I)-binding protein